MSRAAHSLTVAIVLALASTAALPLGIGRVGNATMLGQPLDLSAAVSLGPDEAIGAECVTAEVLAGDTRVPPAQVQVQIDRWVGNEQGATAMLHVRTSVRIDEPIVTVNLQIGCPPHFSRRLVAFVDPPAMALAQTAPAEAPAAEQAPISVPASAGNAAAAPPRSAVLAPPRRAGAPARERPGMAERRAERRAIAHAPRAARPSPVQAPARAAPPRALAAAAAASTPAGERPAAPSPMSRAAALPAGPRLTLDSPLAADTAASAAASAPSAVAAARPTSTPAAMDPAAAAAATRPAAAAASATIAAAADPARVQSPEPGKAAAPAASEVAVPVPVQPTLQGRLLESERTRWVMPAIVYGILALALVLLAVLAVLLWRQRRSGPRDSWYGDSSVAAVGGASRPAPSRLPDAAASQRPGRPAHDATLPRLASPIGPSHPAAATPPVSPRPPERAGTVTATKATSRQAPAAPAVPAAPTPRQRHATAPATPLRPPNAAAPAADDDSPSTRPAALRIELPERPAGSAPGTHSPGAAPSRQGFADSMSSSWGTTRRLSSPSTRPGSMSDSEADREITVEELIDLEQQAEFFVVIGQDEAAIDLLMAHVRSSGGKSPLPYLKLLDIYHRRGERETYERLRERFNRRFNAYAPDWATGPSSGPSLEAYPAVMSQLQTLWPTPDQALPQIEALLFRRHSNEGTFALPAYAELLFLAAIARDLAEQAAPAGEVDLLLPLGGPEPAAAPRRSAGAAAPGSPVDVELHLDLDLDGPPEPPSPGVIH